LEAIIREINEYISISALKTFMSSDLYQKRIDATVENIKEMLQLCSASGTQEVVR
jgi:mevalonate pyrophosphate decarboxylase